MLPMNIDHVDKVLVDQLITDQVPESRDLEYKRELPGDSLDSKKEFLADVSSFANAAGGYILFGIDDRRDQNGHATGLPASASGLKSLNTQSDQQRLENMIQTGIEPRIEGIRFKWIPGFSKGPLLTMRVPQSWQPPHAVVLGRPSLRFYSRNSTGKHPLGLEEIRALYVQSERLPEQIRTFHASRLGKIVADQAPVPMVDGPLLVLHVVSVDAMRRRTTFTMAQLEDCAEQERLTPYGGSGVFRGVDGLTKCFPWNSDRQHKYIHLFRDASVESVSALPVSDQGSKIGGIYLQSEISKALPAYISYQGVLGLPPPFAVFVTLVRASALTIISGDRFEDGRFFDGKLHAIGREIVAFPEFLVEALSQDLRPLLMPIFDMIWQSSGWRKSPSSGEPPTD